MRFPACVVLCISLLLLAAHGQTASITVDEASIRAHQDGNLIAIELPVRNSGAVAESTLSVELLNASNQVLSHTEKASPLPSGGSTQKIAVIAPPPGVGTTGWSSRAWDRVRYTFSTRVQQLISGIVALGAIEPELFQVRIAYPVKAKAGEAYSLRVQVENPVTRVPASAVRITGALTYDAYDDAKPQLARASTGANGEATLTFTMPREPKSEPHIELKASRGSVERTEELNVEFDDRSRVIISTDKELYQPGQALHARALLLGPDTHAYAKQALRMTLENPDQEVVFRDTAVTNEYGIARVDWDLPESLRLGDYQLKIELPEAGGSDDASAVATVKISRYDLPNFSVSAQPDRPYYLPGQNGEIKIGAKYLFGKPVLHASLRVIREEQRHWNYADQKWEADESEEVKGALDASGEYTLKIDLTKQFDELSDETYSRFRDLSYAAYVTDTSTGKTEQRRFTLRLSRDRVHLYVVQEQISGGLASFYVSTYYPDGSPAACNIQLSEVTEDSEQRKNTRLLRMLSSNRYGVAKVSDLPLTGSGDHNLRFVLIDASGAWTTHTEDLWFGRYSNGGADNIILDTDRALYKSGDGIFVAIRAPRTATALTLDVTQRGANLRTYSVHPHNGRATMFVPYEPSFKGEITLVAYNLSEVGNRWNLPFGAHTVLFPEDRRLSVDARLSKASYRPGEDADVTVHVSDKDNNGNASALGVVIFDKAVEERIRTDQDFNSAYRSGFWNWGWWYDPASYGGISREDLASYDMEKGVAKDFDLVAEVLLNSTVPYALPEISGGDYAETTRALFIGSMEKSVAELDGTLRDTLIFPRNVSQLKYLASEKGIDLEKIVDPWNQPYRYGFGLENADYVVSVTSAGPDKKFGTADDLSLMDIRQPFFAALASRLGAAVKAAHEKGSLRLKDAASLESVLAAEGMDFSHISDPWGHPYHLALSISGDHYVVWVRSGGPTSSSREDQWLSVWTANVDYFDSEHKKIQEALIQSRSNGNGFPRTERQFLATLHPAGIDWSSLQDPWGNGYYLKFTENAEYSDQVVIRSNAAGKKQESTPVTNHVQWIRVFSKGPDGRMETGDDVEVGRFMQLVSQQSGGQLSPVPIEGVDVTEFSGAIRGTVTDPTGAVVSGATVIARRASDDSVEYKTKSDNNGKFLLRNLPSGIYAVTVNSTGFTLWQYPAVAVRSASATELQVQLQIGGSGTTVEITAEAATVVETTSSTVSAIHSPGEAKLQNYTPRLRQYFPETLLWEPSVITRPDGSTKLHFKLADNITTWKLSLLASDKQGRIGFLQKELQSFQPFFVEHDPPKILTAGDELQLPVVIRNYLDKSQNVDVSMRPEAWFTLLDNASQQIAVPAGDSSRAIFGFRTTGFVHDGKQRVTAANHALGDAVERAVTVHPDGREETTSISRLFSGQESFAYELPAQIISGSLHAEIKIYPNLLAHAVEAIEAGMERPYGCGEQTISSTYPSLLVLEYLSKHPDVDPVTANRARHYLYQGYRRLLNYRSSDGGFTYWGTGDADPALTAYAIHFLREASPFVKIDDDLISDAEAWLIKSQKSEEWLPRHGNPGSLTAYVALTLAGAGKDDKRLKEIQTSVTGALNRLDQTAVREEDPYEVATIGLLALNLGDRDRALQAATILRRRSLHEAGKVYWELVENTPFYGWGHAGAIETTALVVRFLYELHSTDPADQDLINRGLLYLIGAKDRYGVWYSGQTTQQVLRTMMDFLEGGTTDGTYNLLVNGKPAGELKVAAGQIAPSTADLSKYLGKGRNEVVVQRNGISSGASLQITSDYYRNWEGPSTPESTRTGELSGLRLKVEFDKHELQVGETATCKVQAERFGAQRWGMLLAEIGLPPGVDVDRASLEKAMEGYEIQQYDILPDRIVFYLWPRPGGSKIEFAFRPRIAMRAKNAQSDLYDYYNPEDQTVVAPEQFTVGPELGNALAQK